MKPKGTQSQDSLRLSAVAEPDSYTRSVLQN